MNCTVCDPAEINSFMQHICEATYRSAIDNELSKQETHQNMVSFCEEFFNMDDANEVWEIIYRTVNQIEAIKEATE
jgi:hypothetical protein